MIRIHMHDQSLEERKLTIENHKLTKKLKKQSELQTRITALMNIITEQRDKLAKYEEKYGKI